jgi:hypothetical protein
MRAGYFSCKYATKSILALERLVGLHTKLIHLVVADGRQLAAQEGGALAGPSAHTSTSTWWARVTLYPCHAWHGRGPNEVPAAAIRVIINCREAVYEEIWKSKYPYPNTWISRSADPMCFSRMNTRRYSPDKGAGAASFEILLAKGVRDGLVVGRGFVEMAADS